MWHWPLTCDRRGPMLRFPSVPYRKDPRPFSTVRYCGSLMPIPVTPGAGGRPPAPNPLPSNYGGYGVMAQIWGPGHRLSHLIKHFGNSPGECSELVRWSIRMGITLAGELVRTQIQPSPVKTIHSSPESSRSIFFWKSEQWNIGRFECVQQGAICNRGDGPCVWSW